MSSFFTTPASHKKRKLESSSGPFSKRRNITNPPPGSRPQKAKSSRQERDESISGSGSESEPESPKNHTDSSPPLASDTDSEDETAAEKRLRLAEQYLQNIKGTVDEAGFDAEDVDRDLIAERLQEDVAETRGRLHRHIAGKLEFGKAVKTYFRGIKGGTTTGVASCGEFVYTVSKDMHLVKWRVPEPPAAPSLSKKKRKKSKKQEGKVDTAEKKNMQSQKPVRRRPIRLLSTHGQKSKSGDQSYQHHTAPILCVAASPTGQFVATGGSDRKLIIWSAETLSPLKVFTQHRDAVTSLAFRRGTNQLYSASKDRTIKTWSLNELAYVETLFGHQDEVLDVCAGMGERCISVGGRDRTSRLWKVAEETQLVFRGGGSGEKKRRRQKLDESGVNGEDVVEGKTYTEGSIDCVALVDEETFVTGSDNGSISLWSVHKKKPVCTVPMAHGLDSALKPEQASAEIEPAKRYVPERNPRWITALTTVPYSDLVVSGSWDGEVRAWRVGGGKRSLEAVGIVGWGGEQGYETGIRGVVNDLNCFERGERGKETLSVVVAVGTECRLGRWKKVEGKNGAAVFEVRQKVKEVGHMDQEGSGESANENRVKAPFGDGSDS